jgi:hypothetical protein
VAAGVSKFNEQANGISATKLNLNKNKKLQNLNFFYLFNEFK